VLNAARTGDYQRAWESIQRVIREISRPGVPGDPSPPWVLPLLESAMSASPSPRLAPVAVIAALYLVQHVLDATTA